MSGQAKQGTVHVVGAGLAGLSTAVHLAQQGRLVALYEAAPFAGGRCRTFHDPRLGRDVDNGNHLVLSGNGSARAYLKLIDGQMVTAADASFDFADLKSHERWRITMNDGAIPWWALRARTRIPGTRLWDYFSSLRLAVSTGTVAEAVRGRGLLWQRFWEPMTLAVLNTTPERGSAKLLWRAMAETFAKGGAKSRPMFAPKGLGRALIDPAVAHLSAKGIDIAHDHALKGLTNHEDRAKALHFSNGRTVDLGPQDQVVLALPATRLKAALPWITVPRDNAGILNAHFLVDEPEKLAKAAPITGLTNTMTHWIFVKGDVVSLTVSAADRLGLMDEDPEDLARTLWKETAHALDLTRPPVQSRINKERRATIDQSPEEASKRPKPKTPLANLFLAGDGTATGLPATIEGAIRSGETAAKLAA